MRHLVIAACGAALALAANSAAVAASFAGAPFLISEGEAFTPISGPLYETPGGDLAAVLAFDETPGRIVQPDAVYLKLFNADGTLKRPKTLVYRAERTPDGPGKVGIAGALPLADGRVMVGYFEERAALPGVFARIVTDGGTVGPELAIHTDPPAPEGFPQHPNGFLLPLTSGGVAVWANFDSASDLAAGAQLVSGSGEISAAATDVARVNAYVTGVSRYLDGFIVRYANPRHKRATNQFVQIFGPDGEKVGPEKQIEQRSETNRDDQAIRAIGLTDGSIVVLRKTRVKRSFEFSAEVFDDHWMRTKAETVIATSTIDAPIEAAAVAGGDFLFGAGFADGLGFQRLNQSLKKKGAPIRMTGINSPLIQQMFARANGDVVMTYTWYTPDSHKVRFSGRVITP